MWKIYEVTYGDYDDVESFFGVTNDPIAAERCVKDGYIVVDMDTLKRYETK